MATTYKTPGVYVEEIPKLPPSVAEVETAIPAFIGYTAKADDTSEGDLKDQPVRIGSLVEYEQYYGAGPAPIVTVVNINASNNFVSSSVANKFFMYDALRMFYANGGGDCYIISIGTSVDATTIAAADFTNGITALEKEDTPTLILYPDAATIDAANTAPIHQAALLQCSNLQDRFSILDLKENDPLGIDFRNTIGINNLKYGAAYTPWLKVNLPKVIKYPDIKNRIKKEGIDVAISGLTADADILAIIAKVEQAYADQKKVTDKTSTLNSGGGTLSDGFNALVTEFNKPAGNTDANLKNIFDYLYTIAAQVDDFVNGSAPDKITLADLLADLNAGITNVFDKAFNDVVSLELEAETDIADTTYTPTVFSSEVTASSWLLSAAAAASGLIDLANDEDRRTAVVNLLKPMVEKINTSYQNLIINAVSSYTKTLDESLVLSFPVYKNILNGVSNALTTMPPSGAVAGVYAQVDRTRGVWKAPANVSLNYVLSPATVFTASQLDNLNVDAISGKSINAIRSFTGKGTLVWGARTLAGNDNEWRYIAVRRFFNMVEESSKKATETFVFEPNDANSWVKIQGMLENYLTTLWRAGALQGAKPEHAFYVAAGLGKTMTSLDILEGRLIVEIGMAVVRPAEFIILRFSHKLAES